MTTEQRIAEIAKAAPGAYGQHATYRVSLRPPVQEGTPDIVNSSWIATVEVLYPDAAWHDVVARAGDPGPSRGVGDTADGALDSLLLQVTARKAEIIRVMSRPYYGG